MMAGGYRCVMFEDLCRLCSNAGKNNIKIFTNAELQKKIKECLPISLNESDKLPKGICSDCKEYVEIFSDFRKATQKSQKLLEGCLNTTKLRNGGQVYIKDEPTPKKVLKPIQNPSPTKLLPNLNLITSTPVKQVKKNVIGSPNQPDFLSTIMQAVGIHTGEETEENITLTPANVQQKSGVQTNLPQYTLTLDGSGNVKAGGQIHYKIENSGNLVPQSSLIAAANEEFLKLKQKTGLIVKKESAGQIRLATSSTSDASGIKKPKINFVIQTSPQKQQQQKVQTLTSPPKTVTATFASPSKAQILNIEKLTPANTNQVSSTKQVIVPIMVRSDGSRNTALTTTGSDSSAAQIIQQALQLSTNQATTVNTTNEQNKTSQPFVYMKLQSNADGQITFMPATAPAPVVAPQQQQIQICLSQQQLQQLGLQSASGQQQSTNRQSTITVQQPSHQITSIQSQHAPTSSAVSPPNTAETQSKDENDDNVDNVIEMDNDDEIYNDTYEEEYYAEEIDSDLNESNEKSTITSEKKVSASPKKKTQKSSKASKSKSQDSYEEPVINPEHSEQAKKQLNLLTSVNTKKSVEEVDSKNDINLTVCDVCKKVFKRKEFLMQHLKSHIGIRPFKCDDPGCNKSFSRKEHLLRHVSSHTGRKEFQCNVCQKMFSRKDNLNKHRRIHPENGQSSARNSCSNCNRVFSNKTQLQKHHPLCDGKSSDEGQEHFELIKNVTKKTKIKEEKKESKVSTTKVVQVFQTATQQQQSQLNLIKTEASQQQPIFVSLPQQQNKIYTLHPNFVMNSTGTIVTTTTGGELTNANT